MNFKTDFQIFKSDFFSKSFFFSESDFSNFQVTKICETENIFVKNLTISC